MKTRHALVSSLVVVLVAGIALAQDNAAAPESEPTPETVCLVDEHLSLWLSLEAADRMVASLEKERRELATQLTKHGNTLESFEQGQATAEGMTLTQIGQLMRSKTGTRETLAETYERIETRLTEVDRTLKRRRKQRAALEEWLDVVLGADGTEGS